MYSKKFNAFIDMWRNDYAMEKSIDEQMCVDKEGNPLPWYTYPAIEYLRQFDYRCKKIFEFGTGYSSLFWAKRAAQVVAVEDNQEWFARWQKELKADNLQIKLCQNDDYEAELDEQFDVIVIDGKKRRQCAQRALQFLNDGGMIIVDDSDRVNNSSEYKMMLAELKNAGLLQIDFFGCCPMNNFTKVTSIFFSRNFDFPLGSAVQPANAIGNLWSKGRKARKAFYRENK